MLLAKISRDIEKLEVTAANNRKVAEKALAELKDSLGKNRVDFTGLKQAVSAKLQPLGVTEIPDDDVSSVLELLRERLSTWQDRVKKKK